MGTCVIRFSPQLVFVFLYSLAGMSIGCRSENNVSRSANNESIALLRVLREWGDASVDAFTGSMVCAIEENIGVESQCF